VISLRTLFAAVATMIAVAAMPAVAGAAPLQDSEANDFPFPGADTIALYDGTNTYGTFGASVPGYKVPFARHGSGSVVGSSPTIQGDALPNGGGAWAKGKSGIWTPGAFYFVKAGVPRYYLFYTATAKKSGGRKCIGVAHSTQPFIGYLPEQKPLVCPNKGDRWAIDADVTQKPGGAVWMTWRDGQRAQGRQSALSAMRLKFPQGRQRRPRIAAQGHSAQRQPGVDLLRRHRSQ
jgi:hypothetical protein